MSSGKQFSASLEKQAIFALCRGSTIVKQKLLAGLTPEHFSTDLGAEAFKRLQMVWKRKAKAVTWSELIEDPALGAQTRASLKAYKGTVPKLAKTATVILTKLDDYRKLRSLNRLSRNISEALLADGIDTEDVISMVVKNVASLHSATVNIDVMKIGSKDENGSRLLDKMLKGETMAFLPTGFKAFDDRSHGILWGSLLVIAAPTGVGKSAVVQTLARNFAMQGKPVLMAALEMANVNVLQREMAAQSGIALSKLINPKKTLSQKEQAQIKLDYRRLNSRIRKAGGSLAYYSSDEDVRLETILSYAKTGGYRVVVIDYIGLLAGTDGDDRERALSRIARQCKVWAGANRAIVVLAAQFKEDGSSIKYATAIKDHAPNMWQFTRSPQDIELGIVRIVPTKSRMQEPVPFELRFDNTTMTVRDLTPEERRQLTKLSASQGGKNAPPRKKGAKPAKSRFFSDLS